MRNWFISLFMAPLLLGSCPTFAQGYGPPSYGLPYSGAPCGPSFDNFAPTWAMLRGFQGFYVGGNGGFASLKTDSSDLDDYLNGISTLSASSINWTAGVQVGYDLRFCNKVVGIVADWNWTQVKTRFQELPHTFESTTPGIFITAHQQIERRLQWFSTIRGRAGFALNDVLFYVTGGGAYAKFNTTYTNEVSSFIIQEHFTFHKKRWGWTVGFGSEFIIWPNWSINAEVLYLQFEQNRTTLFSPLRNNSLKSFDHIDQVWIGRLGLNFRFSLCDYW